MPQPGLISSFPMIFFGNRTLTKTRNINVEGKLLVLQLEQLVLVAVDQVDTRSDVVALLELQADRVTAGLNTVSARVV